MDRDIWCHGAIMTDNGGEINSEEMREIASILNDKVCTTAGESPFQNSLCERVHSITEMMLTKLEQNYKDINEQSLLCRTNMQGMYYRCGMALVATGLCSDRTPTYQTL